MSVADKMGLGPKRKVRQVMMDNGRYRYEIDVTPHPIMGDMSTLTVKLTENQFLGYLAWQNGQLIQNALPDLTPSECEVLTSGMGDEAFHEACMEDDDVED